MDDEFSSWFNHDGGPCPVPVGTLVIREVKKTTPGARVVTIAPGATILSDNYDTYISTLVVISESFIGPNAWEWKYYGQNFPSGHKVPKVIRYRVKKSPGIKLLESLVADPPIDAVRDPERKLLEYQP